MNTRLKIDILHGLLEVEGSESFVRSIYGEFKHKILDKGATKPGNVKSKKKIKFQQTIEKGKKSKKQKRKAGTHSIIEDLDL
ncbi:MAG: hypothetical protein A2Y97_05965 [Nitrospirae bacterium RBG_13_39_12]|nr:MAG: hypothetical protein A2Y97_05965 [Nitrospirae bacterium RBG_13_39_12]